MIGPLAMLARIAAPMSIVFTVSMTNVPSDVTIDRVAFYAGHITLTNTQGHSVELDGYRRIDTDDPSTLRVELDDVPPGTYDRVHFVLGVDSLDNLRGPQEGAFDPMHGMYWTWATGYIFVKVEGTSTRSPQPQHRIEYHVGGFRAPYNNIRRVECVLSTPLSTSALTATIEIDVGRLMSTIDPSITSSVTDPKAGAAIIDRCVDMFRGR